MRLGLLCNAGVWGLIWFVLSVMALAGVGVVKWNGAYVTGVPGVLTALLFCGVMLTIGTVLMMIGWGVIRVVGRFVSMGEVAFYEDDVPQTNPQAH